MNLLQRLKPEYSENLNLENIKHPDLVGFTIDRLENYDYVGDIPYSLVLDLKFLLDVNSPYELFKEI
jgi:hypothetical protein